ncbi:MAG: biopolymer transporter ExbD [Thermodesulfobacteriota bacterium]
MKRTSPVSPDMNVTPLVDVVLVLLIIFMVVAPRMEQDVPVELPGIFNPDPEVEGQLEPLKLSIASDGSVWVEQEKHDVDGAVELLGWKHAESPHRRLVIRADRRLRYGQVRELLARTRQVGFPGTSLLVGEKSRPGQQPEGEE